MITTEQTWSTGIVNSVKLTTLTSNAIIEFTGAGEFDTFICNLDREGFKPCEEMPLILL